ncbi:MAG: AAA family ATPase, partial [Bacteroidota bacterium]
MISRIDISNFKSYKKASLPLAPLTVLIGANASGKSNALEAIRFLSWLAQGQKLSSLQYQVNSSEKVVRGRISDLPRFGEDHFSLGCRLNSTFNFALDISIQLRKDQDLHISDEKVQKMDGTLLYQSLRSSQGAGTDLTIEYNNFARGGKKPQIPFSDQLAIFTQLPTIIPSIKQKKARENLLLASQAFEQSLATILFLDPNPASMREYSFLSENELMGDGRNLSSVLYHLWYDPEQEAYNRSSILKFISSLLEQDIQSLDFLSGPRDEVLISLTETFGGQEKAFDAGLLSDGT